MNSNSSRDNSEQHQKSLLAYPDTNNTTEATQEPEILVVPASVKSNVATRDTARQHVKPQNYTKNNTFSVDGENLLHRMKQHRKVATVNSGIWGGVLGLILFGPIGAVGVGYGSALVTKHSLKHREKTLRKQLHKKLEGQPVAREMYYA
jgi:hypothetical protein